MKGYPSTCMPFFFKYMATGTVVVKMAASWDLCHYDAAWMDDEHLPSSYDLTVPSVDISQESWVFNKGTPLENELAGLRKMQELWASIQFPQPL